MKEATEGEIIEILESFTGLCAIYVYTPLCGTCKLSEQMLNIVQYMLPDLPLYKTNINYWRELTVKWKVETVPCLLICKDGQVFAKLNKMESVDYLYKHLKKSLDNL